jgi:lipopolysaccharide transport system permease protein
MLSITHAARSLPKRRLFDALPSIADDFAIAGPAQTSHLHATAFRRPFNWLSSTAHVAATRSNREGKRALMSGTHLANHNWVMGTRSRAIVIRPADLAWVNVAAHLRRLTEYGDLLRTLSVHRINVRYRQTLLGIGWAVLQPLLMMAIFAVVFSRLARIPSEGAPYALFAYVALLPWTFFATSVTNATGSLVNNTQLLTKVYFPREILPLTYVVAALFDFTIGLGALGGLMAWFRVPLTAAALYLIPLVALLALWAFAVSLLLSAVQVRWRDIGVALPMLVQIWMFISPVIYPLDVVPANWRPLYLLNPVAGIINAFRDVLLRGQSPQMVPLIYAVAVTAIALPVAYVVFKQTEATMADIV